MDPALPTVGEYRIEPPLSRWPMKEEELNEGSKAEQEGSGRTMLVERRLGRYP
jgi:hypothetical protein